MALVSFPKGKCVCFRFCLQGEVSGLLFLGLLVLRLGLKGGMLMRNIKRLRVWLVGGVRV